MADFVHPTVTTIWLEYNNSDHFEPFFCSRCKTIIMKFKGEIVKEEPGLYPHKMPMLIQCKGCKRNYQFIGMVKFDGQVVIHEKIRLDYFY